MLRLVPFCRAGAMRRNPSGVGLRRRLTLFVVTLVGLAGWALALYQFQSSLHDKQQQQPQPPPASDTHDSRVGASHAHLEQRRRPKDSKEMRPETVMGWLLRTPSGRHGFHGSQKATAKQVDEIVLSLGQSAARSCADFSDFSLYFPRALHVRIRRDWGRVALMAYVGICLRRRLRGCKPATRSGCPMLSR